MHTATIRKMPMHLIHTRLIGIYPNVFSPEYVVYRNPSLSTFVSYTRDMGAAFGNILPFTKINIACSGGSCSL